MVRFNSKREVVRQLIRSYLESCKLHEDLDKLKISFQAIDYLGEHCADCAMDIIGFPVDDSGEDEESTFCRDWLFDAAPANIELASLDSEVDKYVDFLFHEYEELKKEKPGLFE